MARSNNINLGISSTPEISDPILFREFLRVYNALNILAQSIGGGSAGTFTTLNLTGGQIAFPATQNPSANVNTLDDYEEGTFIPTISFGGASVGIVYTNNTGVYTKIGNTVFYSLNIVISSKGTSVGAMLINGLPFTVHTNPASGAPGSMIYVGITTTGTIGIYAIETTASLSLVQTDPTGVSTVIANTVVANATTIRVSGHYIV